MALFKLGTKKKPAKNTKAVVGKANKSRKISKLKVAYLSMAAFTLLSAIGYTGYGYFKVKSLTAHAENWTYLYYSSNPRIRWMRACKTLIPNTQFGNLYKVNFQVYRNDNSVYEINIQAFRPPSSYRYDVKFQSGWLYGVVAGLDYTVSKDLNDYVLLSANWGYYQNGQYIKQMQSGKQNGSFKIYPYNLRTC